MVPCYVFYIHLKPINHLIRFEKGVFEEHIYRFRYGNHLGKLSPCSLLGWGPTFFSFE